MVLLKQILSQTNISKFERVFFYREVYACIYIYIVICVCVCVRACARACVCVCARVCYTDILQCMCVQMSTGWERKIWNNFLKFFSSLITPIFEKNTMDLNFIISSII